ncbi:MAG TPA: TerC family protein [Polyangiaceae bacterium]|nr:TerC family protein [Polyangiaceae bacterium]
MQFQSVGSPGLWLGFLAFVLAMLALDLGVFQRRAHQVKAREALTWTGVWIALALSFNLAVYLWFGADHALEFLAGYLIEKALSVDNLFVFIVVFAAFKVPAELQQRVLLWGVLGALVLRALFIVLGAALLQRFHWISYFFGALLVFTSAKLLVQREGSIDPQKNLALRLFRRFVPSVEEFRGGRFVVMEGGKRYVTPLLLVLIVIEASDIMFAIDSIPAVFAVTEDPFIVFTSNVFAILGLRALYFALADIVSRFHYLKPALAFVLAFVGGKMLLGGVIHIPIGVSLGVIAGILGSAVVLSLLRRRPATLTPLAVRDSGDQSNEP